VTRMRFRVFVLLVLGFGATTVRAQNQSSSPAPQAPAAPAPQTPATPQPAKPADVASPDAILAAVYDVISGPAGQKRDWDRFLSLYLPGARLVPTFPKKEGGIGARVLTPEEYVSHATPVFEKEGFFEKEAARQAERYGNIMQVFSTYESRHDPKDAAPFARGINSFQLFFDGARWWVVTVFWQQESPDTPLPKEFLPVAH
jgi:hypothetical protein